MKAYLELADIELMEGVASSQRDRLLIRLLSRLGCRISEVLALRVKDVDFEQNSVTILHLKRSNRVSCPRCRARLGSRYQFCPLCGDRINDTLKRQQERRRMRVLPIDQRSIEMLKHYLSQNHLHTDGDELLFRLNQHRAWQIVRECAKRARLPHLVNPETGRLRGVSPHRLRDAFSVHAMKRDDSGDALRMLQEHLGHASFNTTAKYRKIAGDEQRKWYNMLWNTPNY